MDSQSSVYSMPLSGSRPGPAQQSLSMKNTAPSSQRGPPPSTPTKTCNYPIQIPESKFNKAVKLYTQYMLAEGLAQRHGPATDDPLLSPATAQSATSRSTRKYTPSVSTSTYDAMTDISSLISFTGEEGSPRQGNGGSDLIAYNGKRVKHRVRKPLSPTAKAKAALIRYLGSCASCHHRRVPVSTLAPSILCVSFDCPKCPLNHHDVEALERGRQAKSHGFQQNESQDLSQSSISASSQSLPESDSTSRAISSSGALTQSNTLLGLGQNEELLHTFSTSSADLQSFAGDPLMGDPLAGIQVQGAAQLFDSMQDSAETSRLFAVEPYSSFQDGQLLPLGVLRNYFVCQHLSGLCGQLFDTSEELEDHFETAHFEFMRLNPSCHYECSKCHVWSNAPATCCPHCRAEGHLEVWAYGTFIRTKYYRRYPPDSHDRFAMDIFSLSPLLSSYNLPGTGSPAGSAHGGAAGFNGATGGYNYQNHNSFQAPNQRGYGFDTLGSPPPGGYRTREGRLTECGGETWGGPARSQKYHRYKSLLAAIVLVVSTLGVVAMHRWLAMKGQSFRWRSILPAIGFIGEFSSFMLGYSFWSTKHPAVHRDTRMGICVSSTSTIILTAG